MPPGAGVNAHVKHNEFFRVIKNLKWRIDPFDSANQALRFEPTTLTRALRAVVES